MGCMARRDALPAFAAWREKEDGRRNVRTWTRCIGGRYTGCRQCCYTLPACSSGALVRKRTLLGQVGDIASFMVSAIIRHIRTADH